jgi:hypothetical protein
MRARRIVEPVFKAIYKLNPIDIPNVLIHIAPKKQGSG